jgi:hypothetical protein
MLGASQVVDQKAIYTCKERGVFYFSRRVPKALQPRFDQARVVICLHTRSLPQVRKSANALASQLKCAGLNWPWTAR